MTALQAFDALIYFIEEHGAPDHTFGNLLDELYYHLKDGEPITNLPGVWHEWLQAIERARTTPRQEQ